MSLTTYDLAREFLVCLHDRLKQQGNGTCLIGDAAPGDTVRCACTANEETDYELPIQAFVERFIVPAAASTAAALAELAGRRTLDICNLPLESEDQAFAAWPELGLSVRSTIRYVRAVPEMGRLYPKEGWYSYLEVAFRRPANP